MSKSKDTPLTDAAPDLLYALTQMLFMHSVIGLANICKCAACENARAAIAKATGVQG